MKLLVKTAISLATLFACTFLVLRLFNLLNMENPESFLHDFQNFDPLLMAGIIIALLMIDLFFAVPTMTVIIFSGFAIGAVGGAISSVIGLAISGSVGYFLSRKTGEKILRLVSRKPSDVAEAKAIFHANGKIVLLLCRALPVLPEVSSCLAGITKMPYGRYLFWYLAGSVPYALISAYAGSVSSFNNPKPAIFTVIGLTTCMWVVWYIFRSRRRKKEYNPSKEAISNVPK